MTLGAVFLLIAQIAYYVAAIGDKQSNDMRTSIMQRRHCEPVRWSRRIVTRVF